MAQQTQDQRLVELLGCGLALRSTDGGGLFDLTFTPDGRDLAIVSGIDALAQDLRIALTTGLGTDPFDLNFGFDGAAAMADETDPNLTRERLRVAVIRVLQLDPRISRIRAVDFDDSPESRSARQLPVVATFEILGGTVATLTLSTGALP